MTHQLSGRARVTILTIYLVFDRSQSPRVSNWPNLR